MASTIATIREPVAAEPIVLAGSPARGLRSASFVALMATQFFGVLNDNMLRWLVVRIGIERVGSDGAAMVLATGGICLVLPFLLLAAPAGILADRYCRRGVIFYCKCAEVAGMMLATATIAWGSGLAELTGIPYLDVYALFVVLFLLGCQSALFGPARLSSIPDLLSPAELPAGNGIHGLVTIVAVIGGTMAGTGLYEFHRQHALMAGLAGGALIAVAIAGCAASLLLPSRSVAHQGPRPSFNLVLATSRELRELAADRALLKVALGSAFFWSLASLSQLNVDRFHAESFNEQLVNVGPLLACLSVGVGAGNLLAGLCSRGRIELGMVPVSGIGIVLSSVALAAIPAGSASAAYGPKYLASCAGLLALGTTAGMFDVPLQAFLQRHSDPRRRGSILAAANFLCYLGMILSFVLFSLLYDPDGMSARWVFLAGAGATLLVTAYAFVATSQATVRFLLWLITRLLYRVRIHGLENLPKEGGALLVSNHVSWADGVLVLVNTPRHARFLIWAKLTEIPVGRWLSRTMQVIPIRPTPKATQRALKDAREALLRGEVVCIFPEGGITRTGQLMPFKPGLMEIVEGTGAPVIPVYLQGLWGSIFSFAEGKFFWKIPRRWPYPVAIHYGRPIHEPRDVQQVRRAVQDLEVAAMDQPLATRMILPRRFIRNCRGSMRRPKVADSTGMELSGGQLLLRTLIVRRVLEREVLAPDERFVGLLVPPSVGGVLANAALPLAGRVPVNLNYTLSSSLLNKCIERAGIRHVITSRKLMERLKLDVAAELVYLEDFPGKVRRTDKLFGLLGSYVLPVRLLERRLGLHRLGPDDLLTVIFTSGSTGDPKGVMLSHDNVASNIEAIDQVIRLREDDVAIGVLPFFHSYGYTATLWTALALLPKGVYHFNPLDPTTVGTLCREHRATVFMATPTFLRTYLRRCQREDFAALDVVFASAERLPKELSDAFEEKFGVRPYEAYGATELSPLVAVNVPASRTVATAHPMSREGSVGRPIPGVVVRVVDPETWEELPVGATGMLLVKGPNVMKGYLHQPELTAEKIRDGWYITGDLARLDEDGFLFITGRESRFSKIGGEMVPHGKVEEAIAGIIGAGEDQLQVVVTAVPDEKKGERLVVIHTPMSKTPDEVSRGLADVGLPNLWIPSPDSFIHVEQIPVLGTGKLDLKGIRELALERFGEAKKGSQRAQAAPGR